ncbi:zinc ribbon domain-containing protein [Halohasta litorea]|uniref:Zinc ribbon domain-containing protein n=1 Tax=Halohasta litorea TaxID=869891 RepID=A0ABD6DBM2_9EURY|nr:zinc ribbon domain-containing protein [Halohasta litorea]
MGQSNTHKRPWLAALLSAIAMGLGQLYLRRWRRAIGWLIVLLGVNVIFVDQTAVTGAQNGELMAILSLLPVPIVGALCVLDAYVLAHATNTVREHSAPVTTEHPPCPNCGKELDPELTFCHWCTTEIEWGRETEFDQSPEKQGSP